MHAAAAPHPRGHIAHLRVGFAPQRKSIGMLARHLDRRIGAPPTKIGMPSLLIRLHLRKAVLNLVIFAVIGERLLAGPFGADDIEELVGAGVALVLVVDGVAVLLSSVALPPVMTCSDTRPPESWSMVASWRAISVGAVKPGRCAIMTLEPVGDAKHMLADLLTVRRGGMKGQQRPVEAGDLMGLRHRLDVGTVEDGSVPHDGLGRIVVGDESDEFH